jgi:predicted dehydrogenase
MGRWHARVLGTLKGIELAAAADPDQRARDALRKIADVPVHASLAELLAAEPVDVVSVCTPPSAHLAAIEAAAGAGKHVLVEKPFTLSVADADRAIACCERAGVHLGVVHQQRARSASRAVHRLLQHGRLGMVRLAVLTHSWHRTAQQLEADPWRGRAHLGGGVLHDQATHTIDLAIWMLGVPRWVAGHLAPAEPGGATGEHGSELTATALLGFEGALVATLAASTVTNGMRDDIALELFGSRGGVRLEIRDYDNAEIAWLDLDGGSGRARRVAGADVEALVRDEEGLWRGGPKRAPHRLLRRIAGLERGALPFRSGRAFLRRRLDRLAQAETGEPQGHAAVLTRMAAAVRGEGEPLVTGREARATVAVIQALRESHASGGARVEVARA